MEYRNSKDVNYFGNIDADAKKLEEFWNKYGNLYHGNVKDYISTYLISEYIKSRLYDTMPYSILTSIYAHCGILLDNQNLFKCYLKYLENTFDKFYDKSIMEISCGHYPILVEMIAKNIYKNNKRGNVTGIDPEVIIESLSICNHEVELHKQEFSESTDIKSHDILIGLLPCEATFQIINKACNEEKEMSIVPCKCLHNNDDRYFVDYEEYLNYLVAIINKKKSANFEFEKFYFKKEYKCPPALSLIRK